MTQQQFYWLTWFAKHGGRGRMNGNQVLMHDGSPSGGYPAVPFLHLVALGAIAGGRNELVLTEYGQRLVERTWTPELELPPP